MKSKLYRWTLGVLETAYKLKKYVKDNSVEVIYYHLDLNKFIFLNKYAFNGIKLFYTVHTETKELFGNSFYKKN